MAAGARSGLPCGVRQGIPKRGDISMPEFHAEPYIYLAGLTHKSALIAWGAFYFRITGKSADGQWKLVDDRDLARLHPPRQHTIGASSAPYGPAVVEVGEAATGHVAQVAATATANHVLVTGLVPDTEYTYTITVNQEAWAAGERRDWVAQAAHQGLIKQGHAYDNRFRTHPHPEMSAPLCFAVLGDYGTGIRKSHRDPHDASAKWPWRWHALWTSTTSGSSSPPATTSMLSTPSSASPWVRRVMRMTTGSSRSISRIAT
jgi:hypothetical protein